MVRAWDDMLERKDRENTSASNLIISLVAMLSMVDAGAALRPDNMSIH